MAPNSSGVVDNSPLRIITSILNSAKDPELPAHVASIVRLLSSSALLDNASANSSTKSDVHGILLHKFKTRLSALLQSKSVQARWSGVILVKASVESSFECLTSHGAAWTRLLLPLLTRPEPPATHRAVLATLSSIFNVLTVSKPTLTREVTTPNLPGFLTNTITLCSSPSTSPSVLASGLSALLLSLRSHSVTFRPFATKAQNLVLNLLSTHETSSEISKLARRLFVSMPLCVSASQKRQNGATTGRGQGVAIADEWTTILNLVIQETHLMLDRIFRSVVEDSDYGRHVGKVNLDDELKSDQSKLGLGSWEGMRQGVARAELLLSIIADFYAAATTVQVNLPYGAFLILCSRVMSLVPPAPVGASPVLKKKVMIVPNTGVEKAERDLLIAYMPVLHAEVLAALDFSVQRLSGAIRSFGSFILEQLVWIFTTSAWNITIRNAVYDTLYSLLTSIGPSLSAASTKTLSPIISTLLSDIIPSSAPAQPTGTSKNIPSLTSHHADTFLAAPILTAHNAAQSATRLLSILITHLPYLRSELRTQIDRTAILTGNKEAVLASVLYPPQYVKSSLMPFLREWDGDLEVEGTLRPRIWSAVGGKVEFRDRPEEEAVEEEDEESEDSEDEVMEDAALQEVVARSEMEQEAVEDIPQAPRQVETSVFAQSSTANLSIGELATQELQPNVEDAPIPSPKRQRTEMEQVGIETTTAVTETWSSEQIVAPKAAVPEVKPDTTFAKLGQNADEDSDLEIPEINMDGDTSDEEDEE